MEKVKGYVESVWYRCDDESDITLYEIIPTNQEPEEGPLIFGLYGHHPTLKKGDKIEIIPSINKFIRSKWSLLEEEDGWQIPVKRDITYHLMEGFKIL